MSAYSTDQPLLLREGGIEHVAFLPRAGGIDFYGDTLFTTESYLREHPERIRAFLDATAKGWLDALAHRDELIDLIYESYSQRHSREYLAFEADVTARLILPDVVEIGYMTPGRWRHIADTYAGIGMMPTDVKLTGFLYQLTPDVN